MNYGNVKVWERDVIKPTYNVFEDPLPYFESRHYPYTKLNVFSPEQTYIQYGEVVMENDFLQLIFIPTIGARIFSAFNKTSGSHIFNYIDLIRPTLIAARGAWIAVGLEFNLCSFPSHTVDNFSPVDYTVRENCDGSASVILGNLNLTNNIEYNVIVTLRPNSSRIETEIRTFNISLIPEKYYFWSNAAIPASYGLKIFYPGHQTNIGSFPIDENGVDLSLYRNYVRPTSLFILDSEEDFFAAYNYDYDMGVVHVADHNMVPGKKFFTWGISEDGLFWKDILSDRGVPYIEIQSGRFLTQGIVELANPLSFEPWTEYWYPIIGLNGLTFANENVAINVEKIGEEKIKVAVSPAVKYENARLEISDLKRGVKVYEEIINLSPDVTLVRELNAKMEQPMLKIISSNGDEILSWDFRDYKTGLPETPSWEGEVEDWGWKSSVEELWLKGLDSFKREHFEIAKRFFQKSLEKDPDFSKSLTWLGLISYISGLYADAEAYLRKALRRNPYDEDARYYLCLALMALGRDHDAERNLWKLYNFAKNRSLAFYLLGVLKTRLNLYAEAEEMFRKSIVENGSNLRAFTMLSAVLRKQGKHREALEVLEKCYELMPLDYLVLAESYLLSSDKTSEKTLFAGYQKVLEASKEYIFAGLFDDAVKILKEALNRRVKNPLIYYYLGYALKKMGRIEEARKCYENGEKEGIERVFPHRLMEIDILKDVVDTLQECQVAHYLMGNVLFYKGRWEEALREWKKALQNGLQNAILYRDIGLAYSILTNEWAKAIEAYEKAIELSPKNQMLYVELDDIYSRIGLFRERIGLLEKAPAEARGYALIARLCSAYVDVGEPDKALNILVNTFFEPSEGYYGFWEIYVDALLAKGLKMLKENEVKGALQYFIEATKYPRNLGVGAPHPNYRSDVLQMYYIGLMHEILGDKESAEKVWSEALQRYTDFVSEHKVFQALILKKLKRDAEAKTLLEKIIAEAKSRAEDVREKVDTAESTIARLFSYDKTLAYIHYVIGIALITYGDITGGLMEIDNALKITSAVRHARWVKEGLLKF